MQIFRSVYKPDRGGSTLVKPKIKQPGEPQNIFQDSDSPFIACQMPGPRAIITSPADS